jgi:hypothetical protein
MRLIAVLPLLLLAACDRSPTAPSVDYLVTAFATPQAIRAGTTTNVIIGITNVSDTPQTFDTNFCGPAYVVFNPAGVQLYGGLFCGAIYPTPWGAHQVHLWSDS